MPLKIDFKGLFNKLCIELGTMNDSDKNAIMQEIMEGTGHSNLVQFQADMSVDIVSKSIRYSAALVKIEALKTGGIGIMSEVPPKGWTTTMEQALQNAEPAESTSKKKLLYEIESLKQQVAKQNQLENKQKKLVEDLQGTIHNTQNILIPKLKEEFEKQRQEFQQQLQNKRVEEIVFNVGGVKSSLDASKEYFHKQFPEIIKLLAARNALGWPEQMWIYGAPGSGKTHLAKQIAKALGVTPYVFPGDPTLTQGKILGFNNVATGAFIKGWFYEPYKNGGLACIDEVSNCDSSALVGVNSLDNDEFIFGNGERITRHKDFYLLLFDNTIGTGSTRGYTRNVIDASVRDRATFYELEYDEELERIVYGNVDWANYVHRVRKYVKEHMPTSFYVTSRAIRKGATYLAVGTDPAKVAEMTIFKGMPKDQKDAIIKNVGIYKPNTPRESSTKKKEVD